MSPHLRRYADVMDRVSVFVGHASAMLYAACIALSVFEILMRYGFDAPTQWTFETIMALCASAWVLTAGYVTERRRHISITVFEALFGPRIWRVLILVQYLVSLFALVLLIWAMWGPMTMALAGPERSGSAFDPALPAYLKTALVVGCAIYVLQLVANIIRWVDGTGPDSAGPDATRQDEGR